MKKEISLIRLFLEGEGYQTVDQLMVDEFEFFMMVFCEKKGLEQYYSFFNHEKIKMFAVSDLKNAAKVYFSDTRKVGDLLKEIEDGKIPQILKDLSA